MIPLEERFTGSIIGAAIGDALGMPAEYISPKELIRMYNGRITDFQNPSHYHPCSHLKAGQYTDDTQQIIILAESLIEKKGFNITHFAKAMGEWAYKCRTIPGYDRYSGGTSISASLELYYGADPMTTGKPRATCGSAMRIAPLGLFYHNKIEQLEENAELASKITHTHPAAVDSAVFISHLIAGLTNGENVEETVLKSYSLLKSDLKKNLGYVIQHYNIQPQEMMKIIGSSESSYETVPMALQCFLHSPKDFGQAVTEAANLVWGDTDSIACIAGAMSGAYNGINAIPKRFTENVEDSEKLQQRAKKLLEASK